MRPELLSPAGNFEKLKAAIRYGADAVYLAGTDFGMRAAADNFTVEGIHEAVTYAHARNAKVYLTLNTMPHYDEYEALERYLDELRTANLDAVIVADGGVIDAVHAHLPHVAIHLSTQASVVSDRACNFWQRQGVSRIVLARELKLAEIRALKQRISPELELEAFIHGSMCVSYSGRCLLSQHFTDRDANRGKCTQPCRWNFRTVTVAEEKRPDNPLYLEEHGGETFFFTSKDMCMIEHVDELMESGISSFKIEGRMKSAYYAAVTANAYRMAIDAYLADPTSYQFDPLWLRELESVSHREYATGFYYDSPKENAQLGTQTGYLKEKSYLAVALCDAKAGEKATFSQRNKIFAHAEAELLSPNCVGVPVKLGALYDESGSEIESAPHPFMTFTTRLPIDIKEGDILRGA